MKIFITGGTGFIGKHLIKKLSNNGNHEILLLSRNKSYNYKDDSGLEKSNIKILEGDLSNIKDWEGKIKEFSPEVAVHLAWEGIPNYDSEMSFKNLKYGLDLLSMLKVIGCKKIIFTGSCWEYGKQKGCLNEKSVINSYNTFTSAKNALHWMGKYMAEENDDIQFIWIRPFYVYGPGQKKTSLIPYIIDSIKENKILDLKTPHAKNDFVYVEDVADAIILLLEKAKGSNVYNIGSGCLTSVNEIMNVVYANLNIKSDFKSIISQKEVLYDSFWADLSKIKNEVGWIPKVDIKEGILRMIILS